MKVLFIYPCWTHEYGIFAHFGKRAGVYPPLNLALIAAITERAGHEAIIIDAEVDGTPMRKVVKQVVELKPDLICLTGKSPFFHLTKQCAEALKDAGCHIPVVVGGQHITIMREKAFFPEFDYAVIGECEDTWPEFLDCLERKKDVSHIEGLLFRKDGEVVFTGKHFWQRNLDSLPFPARHLLPMHKYRLGTLQGRKNFTSIQTVRGCPWKCIFCASEELNTTAVHKRSPQSVIREMQHVIENHNIRHFMIIDDVLTLDKKHITEICDLIIKHNLNITFEGSTRANLVDDALVVKMKKAGLTRLSFGLETVDSEMRKTMNKKVPLKYYTEANEILARHDIEALNSVMIGLPGETPETIRKTLNFLRNDRHIKQANLAIAVPYPGTEFYEIAKSGKHKVELMSEDFSEYRRYGTAVTRVSGMSQEELIELQNEGFVKIYSCPWRWKSMLRKNGLLGGFLMLFRVFKLVIKKSINKIHLPLHVLNDNRSYQMSNSK